MNYAHLEVLISTDWVSEHHRDPNIRILEVDEDVLLYDFLGISLRLLN